MVGKICVQFLGFHYLYSVVTAKNELSTHNLNGLGNYFECYSKLTVTIFCFMSNSSRFLCIKMYLEFVTLFVYSVLI